MTIYLNQQADVLTNITCLNTFDGNNTTTPVRQLTTERLMRLIKSNNFQLKKMCALTVTIASIALGIFLACAAAPLAAKAFAICAIVSFAYLIKVRVDQKKWMADVKTEIAVVGQIFRDMAAYFVAKRKVREQEMFTLIKNNERAVLKELADRENTGDTSGKTELIQRSWKLEELKAENQKKHYESFAAINIVNMKLPQWRPFYPSLIQDWGILQLACSTYLDPKPNSLLYVNVDYEASGSLALSSHNQDTPCMK